MPTDRTCPVCGASLTGRRADAECCGPACRRERLRLRRLSAGVPDPPYMTAVQYTSRAQRRAKRGVGG